MKTKKRFKGVVFLLIAVLMLPMAARAERLLADMPNGRGVNKVNISEPMLRMADSKNFELDALDKYGDLIKKVRNIEIYTCEKYINEVKSAKAKFDVMIKRMDTEELVSTEGSDGISKIYLVYKQEGKSDRKPYAMIIYNYEGNTINLVAIQGDFNLEESE